MHQPSTEPVVIHQPRTTDPEGLPFQGQPGAALVEHPMYRQVLAQLKKLLDGDHISELVFLVGPSGVGKSTLADVLLDDIMTEAQQAMVDDLDLVPAILTHAGAGGDKAFDWSTLYREALADLGDPFAEGRRDASAAIGQQHVRAGESPTAAAARLRVVNELRRRRAKYWFIDDAHHMVSGACASDTADQYDVLTSIAQSAGIKIVVIGTYELLSHLESGSRWSHPIAVVHFCRYRFSVEVDRTGFAECADQLLRRGGPDRGLAAIDHLTFLYAGALGCLGVLSDWCTRAAATARMDKRRDLRLEDLHNTRLPNAAIKRLVEEVRSGEEQLEAAERTFVTA